jgi:hypothetical protein
MRIVTLLLLVLLSKAFADDFMSPYIVPEGQYKRMSSVRISEDKPDSTKKDTTGVKETAVDSTSTTKKKKKEKQDFIPLRNPTRALFQGLILPGWGQWYNDKKIKAGIFLGIEAFFITGITYNAFRAHDNYKLAYEAARRGDKETTDYYYGRYDKFYRQREDFIWYTVTWALVSMADAYVDAYMHGFDSDVDIGIYDNQPKNKLDLLNGIKLGIKIRF